MTSLLLTAASCGGPELDYNPFGGLANGTAQQPVVSLTQRRPIQAYAQGDAAWAGDHLFGKSNCRTMSAAGCAIAALAIASSYYADWSQPDRPRDPGTLNRCLRDAPPDYPCQVVWDSCAEPGMSYLGWGEASLDLIRGDIDQGHPVIAEVPGTKKGHFVVITGYNPPGNSEGDFFIYDPAGGRTGWLDSLGGVKSTRRFRGDNTPVAGGQQPPQQPQQPPAPTGDNGIPSVRFISPTGGTVDQSLTVSVDATDDVGVSWVELRVDGNNIGRREAAPYRFDIQLVDGTHTLTALAQDASGKEGQASVTVNSGGTGHYTPPGSTDNQPPTVQILSPGNGTVSDGALTVRVSADDNSGVDRVELRINGQLVETKSYAPYDFAVNLPSGTTNTIQALAFDKAGLSNQDVIQLTVDAYNSGPTPAPSYDNEPPRVTILRPTPAERVTSGRVTVTVDVVDASPIDRVELTINGAAAGTTHNEPYTFEVDLPIGQVTLEVAAFDIQGNRGTTTGFVTVVDGYNSGLNPDRALPQDPNQPNAPWPPPSYGQTASSAGCSVGGGDASLPAMALLLLAGVVLRRRSTARRRLA